MVSSASYWVKLGKRDCGGLMFVAPGSHRTSGLATLCFINYLFKYSSVYFAYGEVPSVLTPTFSKHLLCGFCGQRI